jgi:hypothetical protein
MDPATSLFIPTLTKCPYPVKAWYRYASIMTNSINPGKEVVKPAQKRTGNDVDGCKVQQNQESRQIVLAVEPSLHARATCGTAHPAQVQVRDLTVS